MKRIFFITLILQLCLSVSLTEAATVNASAGLLQSKNSVSFIEYYDNQQLEWYFDELQSTFKQINYEKNSIGQSVEGREIWVVRPEHMQKNKSTILMTVRHHGDESTASWVVEGFLNRFFNDSELLKRFQIIIYPCVNPDGVARNTRKNANGIDLNRVWSLELDGKDEAGIVQSHLTGLIEIYNPNIIFALDMHGSKKGDFFYRSPESIGGATSFILQSTFINLLATKDRWQNGSQKITEGKQGMMRVVLQKLYQINVLTHATPKHLHKKRTGRSISSLRKQGEALYKAVKELFGWKVPANNAGNWASYNK